MAPKPRTQAEYAAAATSMDSLKAGVIELMTRLGDVAEEVVIYVLESAGLDDVAGRIKAFPSSEHLDKAIDVLKSKFLRADGVGPVRVAQFRSGAAAEAVQADAAGRVRELLRKLDRV